MTPPLPNRIWVNGELADADAARVSPLDHGLLVGDGVFETLRVYAGRPFAWRRHLDRLEHSAAGLGLATPDRTTLQNAAREVLRANELQEARLRITVTGGVQPLGSERRDTPPSVIVAASEVSSVSRTIAVVIVPWTRNERGATAGLKTISYAENVRALAYAHERGAGEAIFSNTRDELCEATGSNVFVVLSGKLFTPPAAAGCLLGVTRALVLELSPEIGIECREVAMPIDTLADADEVFLTSTVREVQSVTHVEGRELPNAPGPITARLAKAFSALVARATSIPDPIPRASCAPPSLRSPDYSLAPRKWRTSPAVTTSSLPSSRRTTSAPSSVTSTASPSRTACRRSTRTRDPSVVSRAR